MNKQKNAAQRLFDLLFLGPVTYGRVRYNGKPHVRHQGAQEMARRVRQRANGTHGL